MAQLSWSLKWQRGGAVLGSILGILLSNGCWTPVYLVDREALQRALTIQDTTDATVGVTAVKQDPNYKVYLRTALLRTLPGERVILRKETINVLPAEPYKEFTGLENKMQRVTGEPFSASAGTVGPLLLSIAGGALLASGLGLGGSAISSSMPVAVESCPENCRLGRGLAQIVGGVGSVVLGPMPIT